MNAAVVLCPVQLNGVFPKWSRPFMEFGKFSEFRESDKSLKHELGSVLKILSVNCVLLAQG